MAPKAANGSSKNITPSWLTATSKGSGPRPSVWTSATTKSTLAAPACRSALPGQLHQRSRNVEPDHPSRRSRPARARAIVCAPPPQPMSQTRLAGLRGHGARPGAASGPR